MRARSSHLRDDCGSVNISLKAEIISALRLMLTDAQSEGTKMIFTVARKGKRDGISRLFYQENEIM